MAQLTKVVVLIEAFRTDCGRLPAALDDLLTASRSYAHCWEGSDAHPGQLLDIWGGPLIYVRHSDGSRYSVSSAGRDRRAGTVDDIRIGPDGDDIDAEYPPHWYLPELRPAIVLAIMTGSAIFGLCLGTEALSQLMRRRRDAAAMAQESHLAAPPTKP